MKKKFNLLLEYKIILASLCLTRKIPKLPTYLDDEYEIICAKLMMAWSGMDLHRKI